MMFDLDRHLVALGLSKSSLKAHGFEVPDYDDYWDEIAWLAPGTYFSFESLFRKCTALGFVLDKTRFEIGGIVLNGDFVGKLPEPFGSLKCRADVLRLAEGEEFKQKSEHERGYTQFRYALRTGHVRLGQDLIFGAAYDGHDNLIALEFIQEDASLLSHPDFFIRVQ